MVAAHVSTIAVRVAIFSAYCEVSPVVPRQLLDPDVDTVDLVPRRLGLTKVVCRHIDLFANAAAQVRKLSVDPTSASTVTSAGSSVPFR